VRDSAIADRALLKENCTIEGASVGVGSTVGPFANLRPGSTLAEDVRVGNFVEVKATTLGPGSKASHLTYLGDARLGKGVNVGAGTITCNFDGQRKHQTLVGDDVFIGSDTVLVAPVAVGDRAYVGAGSVITRDVPPGALAIARERQVNKEGYRDILERRQPFGGVDEDRVSGHAAASASTCAAGREPATDNQTKRKP
jgi:bifunctional UDP-N-acetylglucosamine pyrophosphorylase/glucosamine-1-phosphate N-acetyltransferase